MSNCQGFHKSSDGKEGRFGVWMYWMLQNLGDELSPRQHVPYHVLWTHEWRMSINQAWGPDSICGHTGAVAVGTLQVIVVSRRPLFLFLRCPKPPETPSSKQAWWSPRTEVSELPQHRELKSAPSGISATACLWEGPSEIVGSLRWTQGPED